MIIAIKIVIIVTTVTIRPKNDLVSESSIMAEFKTREANNYNVDIPDVRAPGIEPSLCEISNPKPLCTLEIPHQKPFNSNLTNLRKSSNSNNNSNTNSNTSSNGSHSSSSSSRRGPRHGLP